MSFNFSIFVSQPPDAFGMADGYVDLEQPPKAGDRIDVLSGRKLQSEISEFNGRLRVQDVINVAAIGPLLALEDVVLADRAHALRLRDFLENEVNLFVTDW